VVIESKTCLDAKLRASDPRCQTARRARRDEAIGLLVEALRQGSAFNIRQRVHCSGDWAPMPDYPPLKKAITPRV